MAWESQWPLARGMVCMLVGWWLGQLEPRWIRSSLWMWAPPWDQGLLWPQVQKPARQWVGKLLWERQYRCRRPRSGRWLEGKEFRTNNPGVRSAAVRPVRNRRMVGGMAWCSSRFPHPSSSQTVGGRINLSPCLRSEGGYHLLYGRNLPDIVTFTRSPCSGSSSRSTFIVKSMALIIPSPNFS